MQFVINYLFFAIYGLLLTQIEPKRNKEMKDIIWRKKKKKEKKKKKKKESTRKQEKIEKNNVQKIIQKCVQV